MHKRIPLLTLALMAGIVLVNTAQASSDAAWADFKANVQQACTTKAKADRTPYDRVVVDDFGTSSHGIALLVDDNAPLTGQTRVVTCLMNKQTKAVELGSELTLSTNAASSVRAENAGGWWQRWFGRTTTN